MFVYKVGQSLLHAFQPLKRCPPNFVNLIKQAKEATSANHVCNKLHLPL